MLIVSLDMSHGFKSFERAVNGGAPTAWAVRWKVSEYKLDLRTKKLVPTKVEALCILEGSLTVAPNTLSVLIADIPLAGDISELRASASFEGKRFDHEALAASPAVQDAVFELFSAIQAELNEIAYA